MNNNGLLPVQDLTKAKELVYELKISQVMVREVVTVSPDDTMRDLEQVLKGRRIGGVPVMSGARLVGLVSMYDLIRSLEQGSLDDKVSQWMSTDLITVRESESVIEAVRAFALRAVSRLPVVDHNGSLVGIITGGDITRGLLRALDLGYQQGEISKYRASHIFQDVISDDTSLVLRYQIAAREFSTAGQAASSLKRALKNLSYPVQAVRRVAVATYEAEMNIVIHSEKGGEIVAELRADKIRIVATDNGPGIADLEAARNPGFSTAPEWIRELGFGAGMGLTNIEMCSDQFEIESELGKGTRLCIVVNLKTGDRDAD